MFSKEQFAELTKVAKNLDQQLRETGLQSPEIGLLGALFVIKNQDQFWKYLELDREGKKILQDLGHFLDKFSSTIDGFDPENSGSIKLTISSSWEISVVPRIPKKYHLIQPASNTWIKFFTKHPGEEILQIESTWFPIFAETVTEDELEVYQKDLPSYGFREFSLENAGDIDLDEYPIWAVEVDSPVHFMAIRKFMTAPGAKIRQNEEIGTLSENEKKSADLYLQIKEPEFNTGTLNKDFFKLLNIN